MLLTVVVVAVGLAACGRATDTEINQALGITPTATLSAKQIATGTAAAGATAAARTALALAASTPGSGIVALGDVRRGDRQFLTRCAACHSGPNARGGNLLEPGGPGADLTYETLLPLIREGKGHSTPPGPFSPTEIDDAAIRDLLAYILSKTAP